MMKNIYVTYIIWNNKLDENPITTEMLGATESYEGAMYLIEEWMEEHPFAEIGKIVQEDGDKEKYVAGLTYTKNLFRSTKEVWIEKIQYIER